MNRQVAARVGMFLPDLRGGGAERVSIMLATEFTKRGLDVDFILARAEGELIADIPFRSRVIDLGAKRLRDTVAPLRRYLRRERPFGLIASLWPLTALAVASKAMSGIQCKVVLVEHSTLSRSAAVRGISDLINRRLGGLIYGLGDGVVAVSQGVKADLVTRADLRDRSVSVIYNPVRKRSLDVEVDGDIIGWMRSGGSKLVAVGNLKDAKDYPTLLKCIALFAARRRGRLLILGDGNRRGDLERLIAALDIQDLVLMPGSVPDPYPYLEEADVYILSSAWEGLPGALIEALACGTPVVSTDCPSGPAEILENGKYGRLVPVGDPQALAKAIEEALDAGHDRDMLRARGAEFSVERAADQYLELLDPGGKLLAASR